MKLIRRAWAWLRAGYWLVAAAPVREADEHAEPVQGLINDLHATHLQAARPVERRSN